MNPPISELAKRLLTDKLATRQLKEILAGKAPGNRLTFFDQEKRREVVVEVVSR